MTMTREEALARAAQLNAEHPDRAAHHWMARHGAGVAHRNIGGPYAV